MRSICLYFQVHQPFRLRTYRFFDIGSDHYYYDDFLNRSIMQRIADKCYLPANRMMLNLIGKYGDRFRISYSISGLAVDQFEMFAPAVLDSFKELAATGSVEFLTETYAHSLASLVSKEEFIRQVEAHSHKMNELFGIRPATFRNTELVYSDQIGEMVYDMGYNTLLTEGAKHILGWKSPNYLYRNPTRTGLNLLLKNFRLSDDIAFRFSDKSWNEWPLTAEKYAGWINNLDQDQEIVNIFIDYETLGEHQPADSGIFQFMESLPGMLLKDSDFAFRTPAELSSMHRPVAEISVPHPISWADEERDLTAWLGNEMQDEAFARLYSISDQVRQCRDGRLLNDWNNLQASDHFYYMCTKWFSDGDVHRYFNPYATPYEAFINYMNVLSDFMIRLDEAVQEDMPGPASGIRVRSTAPSVKVSAVMRPGKTVAYPDLLGLKVKDLRKFISKADPFDLSVLIREIDPAATERVMKYISEGKKKKVKEMSEDAAEAGRTRIRQALSRLSAILSDIS
ncbi:MAG: alpha-amylase [Bacteroidales bacterium]|nr:alpha-amylase [Bacteroidales bacterium]